MYMTVRRLRVKYGRMEDALAFVGYVVERINTEHGASSRAGVNIGGDPAAISISGDWQSLGEYDAMRASVMADTELQSAVRVSSALFTDAADSIVRVLKPAGDPDNIVVVNTARMYMPRVGEAVAFALEVADFVDVSTGNVSGVATAVTGDRSELSWFGYGENLDEMAQNADAIEGSEEYLSLFKRSEELFVPGSLRQSIWQFVA